MAGVVLSLLQLVVLSMYPDAQVQERSAADRIVGPPVALLGTGEASVAELAIADVSARLRLPALPEAGLARLPDAFPQPPIAEGH